jgi:hypothetical protein
VSARTPYIHADAGTHSRRRAMFARTHRVCADAIVRADARARTRWYVVAYARTRVFYPQVTYNGRYSASKSRAAQRPSSDRLFVGLSIDPSIIVRVTTLLCSSVTHVYLLWWHTRRSAFSLDFSTRVFLNFKGNIQMKVGNCWDHVPTLRVSRESGFERRDSPERTDLDGAGDSPQPCHDLLMRSNRCLKCGPT